MLAHGPSYITSEFHTQAGEGKGKARKEREKKIRQRNKGYGEGTMSEAPQGENPSGCGDCMMNNGEGGTLFLVPGLWVARPCSPT